jgi:HEPN domain-containing protein/predicted nucleotidyltransferase
MSLPTQQPNLDSLSERLCQRASPAEPLSLSCLQRQRVLEKELARYLSILEQQAGIEQIILFGSMVTQQIHEWSDIDLIVIQRSELRFLKRLQTLRQILKPQVGTDLLVYTPEEFRQMREGLFFQAEIISKGVIVNTAGQWLKRATQDLQMAELGLPQGLYDPACFHAQQCVEKSIKAALIHQGTVPPRTRSIANLLQLLPTEFLSDLRPQLDELDSFYMLTRYPDAIVPTGITEITETDAAEAIALARSVLAQVEQRCSTP